MAREFVGVSVPFSEESQQYADAIVAACDEVARSRGRGDMGAVLGALVATQARYLAGISDRNLRRVTRRQLDELLTSQIAAQQADAPKVQTICRGRLN